MANVNTLIDKQDNFELIRDEVASILFVEKENQKVLAATAGVNPALWDFAVYTEQTNPWLLIENDEGKITSETPLINVSFDQMQAMSSSSDNIEMQKMNGSFNIDVFAAKNDTIINNEIVPGGELAARDAQRIVKLVRNILMSNIYTYIFTTVDENGTPIPVRGTNQVVSERTFNQIQQFVPQINDRPAQHVVGARLQLKVVFLEYSPQITGEEMELISTQCLRSSDGFLYFKSDAITT